MEELDLTGVERVLAVMAHPDDVDFGWAGSVAVMTDAGIDVAYCLVTDGDAGGSEHGLMAIVSFESFLHCRYYSQGNNVLCPPLFQCAF